VKTEKNTGTIAFRFRQVLLYIVHTTTLYSAWRWLTKPKHVAINY